MIAGLVLFFVVGLSLDYSVSARRCKRVFVSLPDRHTRSSQDPTARGSEDIVKEGRMNICRNGSRTKRKFRRHR